MHKHKHKCKYKHKHKHKCKCKCKCKWKPKQQAAYLSASPVLGKVRTWATRLRWILLRTAPFVACSTLP